MNNNNCIEFFTATCLNWQNLLEPDKYKSILIDSFQYLTREEKIWLYGFVLMPNHIHLIWRKQDKWINSNIQQQFLKYTAQMIKFDLLEKNPSELEKYKSTQKDRVYHFWERRPYSSRMLRRDVLEQKLEYIHLNPVKKCIVVKEEDYLFSSSRFYRGLGDDFGILTDYREHI